MPKMTRQRVGQWEGQWEVEKRKNQQKVNLKRKNLKLKKDVKNVDANHVYVKNKFIVIK